MSDEQGETVEPTDEEATDALAGAGPEAEADQPADAAGPVPEVDVPEGIVPLGDIEERVHDTDAGSIATEIAALREEVRELRTDRADLAAERDELEAEREELEAERDDLESRLKRKQAEFQNYKKRQERRREEERARATESLVERLLEVRDNLGRALEQDGTADIREGVEATFRQLDEVLEAESVEPIEPDPGTGTDPERHEVLLRVESDQPEGTVAEVHRPGYEMAGKVLRPAQVTVSDGTAGEEDDEATDEGDDETASGNDEGDDETASGNDEGDDETASGNDEDDEASGSEVDEASGSDDAGTNSSDDARTNSSDDEDASGNSDE